MKKLNKIRQSTAKTIRSNRRIFLIITLFLLIFLVGFLLSQSPKEDSDSAINKTKTKEVEIFEFADDSNYLYLTAEVENSQKTDIKALTSGVVFKIYKAEGSEIKTGEKIINLANNYTGGNAASIQASIAYKQYKQAKETKDEQLELIDKQREIANLTAENSEEQRNIAEAALNDTNDLVETSEKMLQNTQSALSGATDPAVIAELEAAIAQQEAGLAQLRAQQRNLSYSANDNEPPAKLAETGKEISLLQLELQEKALNFQIEVARLQSAAASVQASAFFPQSPVNGTVEKIYVTNNEVVNPGQIIATIRSNIDSAKLVAYIPTQFFIYLNNFENSEIIIDDYTYYLTPSYITSIPVKAGLHAVTYEVDGVLAEKLAGVSYTKVKLPIGKSYGDFQLIPLDALYTSQSRNFVYVTNNGEASAVEVEVGEIVGSFVEVKGDFAENEQIIISRNVVAGDRVSWQNKTQSI